MYKYFLLIAKIILLHSAITAQEIYLAGLNQNIDIEFGVFDPTSCTYHTLSNIGKGSKVAPDIAYCPDGNFYIVYFFFGKIYIANIDVNSGVVDTIIPLKPGDGGNSLICRSDTTLVSSEGGGKYYVYEIPKKSYYYLGKNFMVGTSGDLTFYNEKLHGCNWGKVITEVDLQDLNNSKMLYELPIVSPPVCHGMSSLVYTCDSTIVYMFLAHEFPRIKTDVYILQWFVKNQAAIFPRLYSFWISG
ncbi:MAG: hypothetical protein NZM43_02655 [Saprospiraceae bacterium]|nr:hypothetical protein [Saprospiraceae bacterium]MDW8483202.1 hypothetical protein [Saprospiraceae bacterium]